MNIYLIGSLRNPKVPEIAQQLRKEGFIVFDDWYAAGEKADDAWKSYEQQRGHSYIQALQGLAANHVFDFDHHHLQQADVGILILPAGKSGHMELGYLIGRGRKGYILLDNPDRWDVMYKFASGVYTQLDDLLGVLQPIHTYADDAATGPVKVDKCNRR